MSTGLTILPNYVFIPKRNLISAITNSFPALITTEDENGYVDNEVVQFFMHPPFGMGGLNMKQGIVTVLTTTQFSVEIDTTNFDPFEIPDPLPSRYTWPQVVNVGQRGTGILCPTENTGLTS